MKATATTLGDQLSPDGAKAGFAGFSPLLFPAQVVDGGKHAGRLPLAKISAAH